ncbi:MAG: hypothetical protein KatS3mg040_1747 [Candidatus Kapaibacterium sp.]|nr:MAG: hypothetical protein KatS3mg040_1747 [Candidatus Kapabacteria bacterium]
MAHFRFRLETLLRYRKHHAEQAEYEVARLAAEEQSLRAAIEQLHRRMLDEQEQSTTTAAHHLQMLDAHRRSLAEQIRTLEQELDAVRTERERAEQRLIERMQERDVLGRLRQRQYRVRDAKDFTMLVQQRSTLHIDPRVRSTPRQTGTISLSGNLSATLAAGETAQASVTIYDNVGNTHILQLTFTKTVNPGEFTLNATEEAQ